MTTIDPINTGTVTESQVVSDVTQSQAQCTTVYPPVETLVPDGQQCGWSTLLSDDVVGVANAAQQHAKDNGHDVSINHERTIKYGEK